MVDKMRHLDLMLQLQGELFEEMLAKVISDSWFFYFIFVIANQNLSKDLDSLCISV